jgi:hypothetical protein
MKEMKEMKEMKRMKKILNTDGICNASLHFIKNSYICRMNRKDCFYG